MSTIMPKLMDALSKYSTVCPLPKVDVTQAVAELTALQSALSDLVEQVEMTAPRDELGHDFRLNDAHLKAKALLQHLLP